MLKLSPASLLQILNFCNLSLKTIVNHHSWQSLIVWDIDLLVHARCHDMIYSGLGVEMRHIIVKRLFIQHITLIIFIAHHFNLSVKMASIIFKLFTFLMYYWAIPLTW